jgi:hypothetical protein
VGADCNDVSSLFKEFRTRRQEILIGGVTDEGPITVHPHGIGVIDEAVDAG